MTKISGAAGIRNFLEKPEKGIQAVLLYGPNESFAREAAEKLATWAAKGSDDPYAITKLGDDDIKRDSARLADAMAAQSLLGGATVVRARVSGRGADSALLAALEDIEGGTPGAFLIVEAGDVAASSALVKAFSGAKRAAALAFYEESEADRAQFAKALLRDLGVTLDRDAGETLMGLLPEDRGLAAREIEKLAAFAHDLGRPVNADDLAEIIASEAQSALDAASLAAMDGRGAQAVEMLARIESLSGVGALRALLRRLHQVREARQMIDEGASPTDAIAKLRPPVFWKERDAVTSHARRWTAKKLNAAFDLLWQAELRAKTASTPQDLVAADAFRGIAKLAAG